MKCPKCGHIDIARSFTVRTVRGRPKKLNDAEIYRMYFKHGLSYQRIADQFAVTKGAVQAAIVRAIRKKEGVS